MSATTPFDAGAFQRSFDFIDECPEELFEQVINLPISTPRERIAGVTDWQRSLLAGELPSSPWPDGPIGRSITRSLEELDLPRFCRDQPELTIDVLRSVLDSVERRQLAIEDEVTAKLQELKAIERIRLEEVRDAKRKRKRRRDAPEPELKLTQTQLRALAKQARQEVESRKAHEPDEALQSQWAGHVRAWSEIAEVFDDLGFLLGRGRDLSAGVLRHTGWMEIARLQELVARLPEVVKIIRSLGQLQTGSENEETDVEQIMGPMVELDEVELKVEVPWIPNETRGIERGDRISRMLPSESATLAHPATRMLWHARRAERALLLYRVSGTETETLTTECEAMISREARSPRPERGPMMVVVDTSGSMHGAPELLAKALVLQALKTAHAEKRRCYIYLFSGPGQLAERELSLSPQGLTQFLDFLAMSFHGGTSPDEAFIRALERLTDGDWKKADLLCVTDGEWPAPGAEVVERIDQVKEEGTRFHGVQIGSRAKTGLHVVCNPVHHLKRPKT